MKRQVPLERGGQWTWWCRVCWRYEQGMNESQAEYGARAHQEKNEGHDTMISLKGDQIIQKKVK